MTGMVISLLSGFIQGEEGGTQCIPNFLEM